MTATTVKNTLAVLCVLAGLAVGLPLMLLSETHTARTGDMASIYTMTSEAIRNLPAVATMIQKGLKPYFLGFGFVLLMCAIAFILMDGEDKLAILQHQKDTDTPA